MPAEDGEGVGTKCSPQSVGNGIRMFGSDENARGKTAVCIVRLLRFYAVDGKPGMEKGGGKGASAGQASSADRNKHGLDIGLLFQQLEKSRALSGDNTQIVGGVNKVGSMLTDNFGKRALTRLQGGLAEGNLCTISPDGGNFYGRSILGHDNISGDISGRGCQGKCLGMVSGTVGGNAP